MSTTKEKKLTSNTDVKQSSGNVMFKTYQKLLKLREKTDRELLKMDGKFLRMIKRSSLRKPAKVYSARIPNTMTLEEAIRDCMVPGEPMNMDEILISLRKKGTYLTNSSDQLVYTMVNTKLHRDPKVEKPEGTRGVFIYEPKNKDTRKIRKRGRPCKVSKVA